MQGDKPRGSSRADSMLDLHMDSAEERKLAQDDRLKAGHTAAIGVIVSITHFMTFTAVFHVSIAFIASSA
jgi:hypothetical protein